MRERLRTWFPIIAYAFCMLFITLIDRESGLVPQIQPVPFWSLTEWFRGDIGNGLSIVLNVMLFIPFGYLLMILPGSRKWPAALLLSLAVSLLIECGQYFLCRGVFDVDDLFVNTLGGAVGIGIWFLFRELGGLHFANADRLRFALVIVGIFGCVLNAKISENSVGTVYERQFAFYVDELAREGDEITLSGSCSLYDGKTSSYSLVLRSGSEKLPAETVISGDRFTAKAKAEKNKKYEIDVMFRGGKTANTKVCVRGNELEYVPGTLPDPPSWLDKNAVLKSWNKEYDVRVYEDAGALTWVIGQDIPKGAEIIYHLSTNAVGKLPEERRASRFDNLGFYEDRAGEHEIAGFDGYRVFTAPLPTVYPVTAVRVGYSVSGLTVWEDFFRP